jgi:hypothetical protein
MLPKARAFIMYIVLLVLCSVTVQVCASGRPPEVKQAPSFVHSAQYTRPAIEVSVSDTYADLFHFGGQVAAAPASRFAIGSYQAGDLVEVSIQILGDDGSYLYNFMHSDEVNAFVAQNGPDRLLDHRSGNGVSPPIPPFQKRIERTGFHEVVIRNIGRWQDSPGAHITVQSAHHLAPDEKAIHLAELQRWAGQIEIMFVLPRPLRLTQEPCGEVGAKYMPLEEKIVLCTKIRADFVSKQLQFDGIVYHEFGHALLRMFAFPGWDQENDPDDFAVYLAFQTTEPYAILEDLARWYLSGDLQRDVLGAMQGDPHGTGPQRAEHIRQRARQPSQWSDNWSSKIYRTCRALTCNGSPAVRVATSLR